MEILRAIEWKNDRIVYIDQTRLPAELTFEEATEISEVWDSLKKLKVRGAPAIGIMAGYGVLLSAIRNRTSSTQRMIDAIKSDIAYLKTSRPTAVNLFWALQLFENLLEEDFRSTDEIIEKIQVLAFAIHEDDRKRCDAIGSVAQELIRDGMTVLTHCNTGALATGGIGTALGIIYRAHELGKKIRVFADETRPLLQGSRLTALELQYAGIDVTVIADNMAAYLMQHDEIDLVLVGADRITANGDTANKIGTYSVAVNAYYHDVPFYVAAPLTTFDLSLEEGSQIPIEQRDPMELRQYQGKWTAPENIPVFNPAFDVTPHELITGIITDKGIIRYPDSERVKTFYHNHFNEPKLKELL